jgi:hypothetical protein
MTLYKRTDGRFVLLKVIGVVLGLLVAVAAAEWFVTFCAFSNRCPAVETIGDWPLGQFAQFGA